MGISGVDYWGSCFGVRISKSCCSFFGIAEFMIFPSMIRAGELITPSSISLLMSLLYSISALIFPSFFSFTIVSCNLWHVGQPLPMISIFILNPVVPCVVNSYGEENDCEDVSCVFFEGLDFVCDVSEF